MLTGATYEIQQLKNNARVIDYVDTHFDFFECTKNAPAIDPFEEFLDVEGSIFPFVASSKKPYLLPLKSSSMILRRLMQDHLPHQLSLLFAI